MRSRLLILAVLIPFITACKPSNVESVLGTTANESYQGNPIRLSTNKKFVKYRPVNRRLIHRLHRRK
ncbi:MAG: hypothetical protein LCH30_04375 [Proteobacteria bacterium]|nr:hypothetical protein [Pseudomonadota bacterium]